MQKKTFQTLALVAIAMLGTNAFSGQIKNGDFETGDFAFWTKTGTAWGSGPTDSHLHVQGWEGIWFAETWKAGEPATGTLRSDTFELTDTINFLIT